MSGATRWLVIASIAFGVAYMPMLGFGLPRGVEIASKGACVGLLALAAVTIARGRDGWLLVAVMGFGALGDVLLDALGMTQGALAFIAAHIAAITLYFTNRRPALSPSQRLLALFVVPLGVAISWSLPADRAAAGGVALYALFVAAMAGTAWASRFPRYRTGIGAMMFLVSDLLIFARMGPLAGSLWVGWGVWLLYYFGQLLIWIGVSQTLRAEQGIKA